MSADNDVLLSGYVRNLFAAEDAVLEELRYEIPRQGLPEIQISAEVGRLLQVLLTAIGARRVLEIGTLGGYSAIWMARALPPGGRLISIEIDPKHAEFARGFVLRAGLDAVVDIRVGDAREILPKLAAGGGDEASDAPSPRSHPFDAVFIDADKESYGAYLDWALTLVRPGGLIIGDNAFWRGRVLEDEPAEEGTRELQNFNRRLAADQRLISTIIPVRDGVAVAVVRA